MIIKGQAHNNAQTLARYLLREKENEKPFLFEIRDSASEDLHKSLLDWETLALCKTKAKAPLYHAHIRLRDGEALHEAQWMETIQKLEEKLGFTNCPRAVVGHNNAEHGLHVHVVWSRYDPEKGRAISLSNDRQAHHSVAREAEKAYGLEQVKAKEKERGKRRLSGKEVRALKDRGINQTKLEKLVKAAWSATDSGQEMKAMLNALGVEIVPGDRRDWVVEFKGLKMNPVRLLDDVKTADFRERMKDVDLEAEKQKSRDGSPATPLFGRKARSMMQGQFDKPLANDAPSAPPKTGFTRKKRRVLEPRFKPKLRYNDPGI